jgi:hypothetical protein
MDAYWCCYPLLPFFCSGDRQMKMEEQPYLADGMRREENATTIAEEI